MRVDLVIKYSRTVGWVHTGAWRLCSPAGDEERDMTDISWVELLIIIAVIAFLVLVPKRLPVVARWLRRSVRGSKKGASDRDTDAGATESGDTDAEAAARDKQD